ncbi:hypothetical protein ACQ27_gp279 [Klebsiella phage K64-1]|nr:hypothetical protein ACQ27_gp279 [Klebsiella phage K64-1]
MGHVDDNTNILPKGCEVHNIPANFGQIVLN